MKTYQKLLLVLSAVSVIVSCQKEEPVSQPASDASEQEMKSLGEHLISYDLVKSQTVSEVVEMYKSAAVNQVVPLDTAYTRILKLKLFGKEVANCGIVTYKIRYKSCGGICGIQPIEVSGSVSFAVDSTGKHDPRVLESVSLINTIYNTSAEDIDTFEDILAVRSIYNALVVFPYYQGGDLNDTFVAAPSEFLMKGRQAIDCELAALELIKNLDGVEMDEDYYTENMGISNGGGPALAVQYLLENDKDYMTKADQINLVSTYVGEGNCNNASLMPNLLTKYDYIWGEESSLDLNCLSPVGYLSTVVGTYKTWQYKYFEDIKLEDYFSEEFLAYEHPRTGKNLLDQYLANEGSLMIDAFDDPSGFTIYQTVNPKLLVFDEETGEYSFNMEEGSIMNNMFEAFKENEVILSGWAPKARLKIAHCYADEFLLYNYNHQIWEDLSKDGLNRNVEMKTIYLLEHFPASMVLMAQDVLLRKHPVSLL